jgi:hypothetical protein
MLFKKKRPPIHYTSTHASLLPVAPNSARVFIKKMELKDKLDIFLEP